MRYTVLLFVLGVALSYSVPNLSYAAANCNTNCKAHCRNVLISGACRSQCDKERVQACEYVSMGYQENKQATQRAQQLAQDQQRYREARLKQEQRAQQVEQERRKRRKRRQERRDREARLEQERRERQPPVVPTVDPHAPSTMSTGLSAAQLWPVVEKSSDPEDARIFLRSYPESPFAILARQHLEQLESAVGQKPVQTAVLPSSRVSSGPLAGGEKKGDGLTTAGVSERQEARYTAGRYTTILQIHCEDIQTGAIVGVVTLTGTSTASCEGARYFLQAQDEKSADCTWPESREGKKEWKTTEICRIP